MSDKHKTKKQLIKELDELRTRVRELEERENECRLISELEDLEKAENWPEKALHEMEIRYQALIETNFYAIQEIDIYGIITYMNSVQYKILGYSMGELRGKQIWDLLASDTDREELTDYLTRIAEGEYAPFPWTGSYIRKDGSSIKLQVDWNYRKDGQNRVTGFVSVISSILDPKPDQNLLLESVRAESESEQPARQKVKPKKPIPEPPVIEPDDGLALQLDAIHQQLNYLQKTMTEFPALLRKSGDIAPDIRQDIQKPGIKAGMKTDDDSPPRQFHEKDMAASAAPDMAGIVDRLDALQKEFEKKIRYDTHKNKIIDNLHQDLQDYKNDFLKNYLKSVVMDVIQIVDNIRKLANHYKEKSRDIADTDKLIELLQSIPSDLEDLFYRHGVKPFNCKGETFDPTRQRVLKTVETTDASKDKIIAERLRPGYEWDGNIIRPEIVTAYLYKNNI